MRFRQIIDEVGEQFFTVDQIKKVHDRKQARLDADYKQMMDSLEDIDDKLNTFHFEWKPLWDPNSPGTRKEPRDKKQITFPKNFPFKISNAGIYAYAFFENGPEGPVDFTNPNILYIGEGANIVSRWSRFMDVFTGRNARMKHYHHLAGEKWRDLIADAKKDKSGVELKDLTSHEDSYQNQILDTIIHEEYLSKLYAIAVNLPTDWKGLGEAVALQQYMEANGNKPKLQGHTTGMQKTINNMLGDD
jgi:hypothetical protein|tara:strand:+ start:1698 stop:2435 length:738 start_codon:yes stop_codon:yes gene_type:complete